MTLNIVSAEKVEFSGTVENVSLPGAMGSFMVLENHASLVSTLTKGTITYEEAGKTESLEIRGGVADVDNNIVTVCLY